MPKTIRVLVTAILSTIVPLAAAANTFNVREFGARGNRTTNDRASVQAAVDACSNDGGGTVHFPPGDYLSGAIRLRSNVTIHLDAGATLWASKDPGDYQGGSRGRLFVAEDAEHIGIAGSGKIHGQGTADFGARWGSGDQPSFRTGIVLFERCRHVSIRNVTILYSDSWTIHLKRCENVFIDGVTIFNNIHRLNSDGIDPNSCRNVHISNCHIVAGDDCIVLKSSDPYPCENVVVTNCTLETPCTALKLGTESHGDFRDVHFSNCTIRNTRTGIGFYMKDGATMERVTFSNISIRTIEPGKAGFIYPIFMDIERRHAESSVGSIRDVIFRDIQIDSGSGILIQGMKESHIENLTLQNVSFRVERADNYSTRRKAVGGHRTTRDERDYRYARKPSYVTLAYVKGLMLDNVRVTISEDVFRQYERSAVYGYKLEDGTIRGVHRSPVGTRTQIPVVDLHDCRGMSVTD
jgi:polygalacturonase